MSKPKFKVGDIVVIIDASKFMSGQMFPYKLNRICKVTSIADGLVKVNGDNIIFRSARLRLLINENRISYSPKNVPGEKL